MSEKESVKTNEQETRPRTSRATKQRRRYTGENKKVTAKLNEQETGPRRSRGKNKDDNTNLPLTEGEEGHSPEFVIQVRITF
jgi:hypothetical protein